MHVAMHVGNDLVVKESGKGLKKRGLTADKYIVYRWKAGDGLDEKAAEIMVRWTTTLKLKKIYGGLPIPILCSFPTLIPQIFGSSWYGVGAKFRRWNHRHGIHGTMICSEAVIAAYQLAADEIPGVHGNPIKLDSKNSSPMRLAAYLSTDKARWEDVGELSKTKYGQYEFNYDETIEDALDLINQ
jgi:hypothetical protein